MTPQYLTNQIVNKLATQNIDMKGRRDVNCGNAVNQQDYITLADFQNLLLQALSDLKVPTNKQSATGTTSGNPFSTQTSYQSNQRFVNTIYVNGGTSVMMVTATVNYSLNDTILVETGPNTAGLGGIADIEIQANAGTLTVMYIPVSFIVLPGWSYNIRAVGSSTIVTWTEWT
jgi:hypothetical protein